MRFFVKFVTLLVLAAAFSMGIASAQQPETLIVYSGRTEALIQPLIDQFIAETGIQVEVRYGSTAQMAATILEEGGNSPADVYIAQDAGALGALAAEGRLLKLPSDILERVPNNFQSQDGLWVGVSGRARVLVYNTELVSEDQLPASLLALTQPEWAGKVAWAPANGSFQANVTALRLLLGEETTRQWLRDMVANGAVAFENNGGIMQAVINGEIPVGLVNHYYIHQFGKQFPNAPIALHFFSGGDVGSLVNVAGAGIVNTSDTPGLAQRFVLYLLGKSAQEYFVNVTGEYALAAGVPALDWTKPLAEIQSPDVDLSALSDLQGTLELLRETGALP